MITESIEEYLYTLDEITIIDLLNITPELLVERFKDLIEENYDKIQATIITEEDEEVGFRKISWED